MAANFFSRLERFREESQVMAAHWSIALNDEWSVSQSVSYLCRYRAAMAAKKHHYYTLIIIADYFPQSSVSKKRSCILPYCHVFQRSQERGELVIEKMSVEYSNKII